MRAKRKGFTLIELIVAMVLAAMLLGALIPLLVTAQKSTYDAQKKTRAAQAGEAIYTYVADQLRSAERVFIGHGTTTPTEPPADQWNQITVGANGCLAINGVTPYPESYQEGATLTLTAQGHDRTALDLTVQLGDLYEKTSAITLQNLIRSGFSQTEGTVGKPLSTADDGDVLTIYYLGGDGTLPTFPTPGDTTPDASHPTPTEDKLTVTVLNKSLRVKQGESATVQAYIHVPAGKTANFAWTSANSDFVMPVVAEAGVPPTSGTLNASGTVTLKIYGAKVTEDSPITVTLQATLTGTTETKQDTCQVTVYETEPATPNDGLVLHHKSETTGDAYTGDIAGQTVFWKIGDYQNGFTLSMAPKANDSNLVTSEWSIIDADSDETLQKFQNYLPAEAALSYHYAARPPKGWVTIKAKVAEKGNNNAPTDLIGEWTYTTIVFYEETDYTLTAKLAGSPAEDGKSLTVNYPEGTVIGQPAATVVLTISSKDAKSSEILRKLLPELRGNVESQGWDPLAKSEGDASSYIALPGGNYQYTVPLTYQRQMNDWSTTESFSSYGRLTDSAGQEFLKDAVPMTVTVQKPAVPLPTPKLIFRDNGESSLTVDYAKDARIVAELQFNFTGNKAESNAKSFLGQQAAIYSPGIGAWPEDPLVKQPLTYSTLEVKGGDSEGDFILYAAFSLQLARHPKQDPESVEFIASVLTDQSKTATATLKVNESDNEMVLRLDRGGGTGMLITNQTLLIDPKFDELYLSAYENETSTEPLTGGDWSKINRNPWWSWYVGNRWVSIPQTTSFYYNDTQNAATLDRVPQERIFVLGHGFVGDWRFEWERNKCWSDYNWAKIQYTKDGKTVATTVEVQNTTQSYQTGLKAAPEELFVGNPVTLTLDTTYEGNTGYRVLWSVDNTDLFQCPDTAEYTTNATGQDTRTLTLQPAADAATDIPTQVVVTATWENRDNMLLGQKSVTIQVNPLPLELRQRIGAGWAPVTGDLTKAVGEPVILAVFQGTKQLMGTWETSNKDLLPGQSLESDRYQDFAQKAGTVDLTFTSETDKQLTARVTIEPAQGIPGLETPTGDLVTDGDDEDIVLKLEGSATLGYNDNLHGSWSNHTFTLFHQGTENEWSSLIVLEAKSPGERSVQIGSLTVSMATGQERNGAQLTFKQTEPVTEPVVEKFQVFAVKDNGQKRVSSVITVTLLPES